MSRSVDGLGIGERSVDRDTVTQLREVVADEVNDSFIRLCEIFLEADADVDVLKPEGVRLKRCGIGAEAVTIDKKGRSVAVKCAGTLY